MNMNNLFSIPKMKIIVISASIVIVLAVVLLVVACLNVENDDTELPQDSDEDVVDVLATVPDSSESEPESESERVSEKETEKEELPYDETGLYFEKTSETTCTVAGIGSCTKTVIEIPEKSPEGLRVTAIATGAFEDCHRLVQIGIPSSVKIIGTGAFVGCNSLAAFVVDSTNTAYCAVGSVLFSKDKTMLIAYPAKRVGTTYLLSTNVTQIAPYAFDGVSVLEKLLYYGSISRFQEIEVGVGNSRFTQMPIEFNYKAEK